MPASIKEVALRAGVSIATVSRVLSGSGYISAEARGKVEAAVKELGYRPNRVARNLRAKASRVLGLIVSDIRNPFFSEISRAVENAAHEAGYSVLICNTDEDPKKEASYLELMAEEKVAGVLLSPTRNGAKQLSEIGGQMPLVLIDRKPAGAVLDSVVIDNRDAAFRLTRALIDGGYRNIAGIFGAKSYTAGERIKGFEAAFKGSDAVIRGIHQVSAFEDDGERVMREILAGDPVVDAVMCSSALLATGAYKALRQAGARVVRSLGFACFDDPSWAVFVERPVTVIRQPAALIGTTGAELLIKRVENPARPVSGVCLQGELIVRKSSCR